MAGLSGALLVGAPAAANPLDQEVDGPIRIAVVGATRDRGAPWAADGLVQEIEAWDAHVVVLTGGYLTRGSASEWQDWREHWGTLGDRIVAIPDRAAYRGDRELERWAEAGVGPGEPVLDGATWGEGVLRTGEVRWRVLALDTEQKAMGRRWLDQRTWLPKAVRGTHDHLIVLAGRPLASLQRNPEAGSTATRELLDDVSEHARPGVLRAVITGGTRTNELLLHAGAFGEAHLVAGDATVPAADLGRFGQSDFASVGEMALVEDFDAALREAWTVRTGSPAPAEAYEGEALPVRGWWQVELDGARIAMSFQLEQADGSHAEAYRIHYTRSRGWVMAADGP